MEEDLKEGLGKEPAEVLSARPMVREDLSPIPLANANSFLRVGIIQDECPLMIYAIFIFQTTTSTTYFRMIHWRLLCI